MTEKPEEEGEEAATEEETVATEEEEAPKVIEIHAPPPFEEAALEPFIDIFMQKRGLTDRKQAAVKLANVLWNLGYDPRKDIQNVTTYINNLSTVLNSIPDTEETLPVKSSILARGATDTASMMRKAHFGGEVDEMQEFKDIMRFGAKMNMTMKALDSAFKGDTVSAESETVKELRSRVERMEKKSEFEAQLAPIREQLAGLTKQIEKLGEKPKTPEESEALKEIRASIQKVNERLEKKEEEDAFTGEMKGIRDDLKKYADAFEGRGGSKAGSVTEVFDQAITLMDKITDAMKKRGGSGGEEIDWRAAAITTAGEIGTEAIKAARDIMAGKGLEEEAPPKETKQEKVSERIVDRKLLNYIRERAAAGAIDFSSTEAAKKLGVSNADIIDSYQRLSDAGLIKKSGPETETPGGSESGSKEEPESWVEG